MMGQLSTQPSTHTTTSVGWIDVDHLFKYSCGFYHLKSLYSNLVQRGKLSVAWGAHPHKVPHPVI